MVLDKKNKNDPETIVWTNQPPGRERRRPATNNVNKGEVIGLAKDCENEVEVFNLFFSTEMIEIVVHHTNQRIRSYNEANPSKRIEILDSIEFRALCGLFYFYCHRTLERILLKYLSLLLPIEKMEKIC